MPQNAPGSDKEESAPGKPNRLISEKSPYLLQHAYNPVDWHPWGEEAFEKARREDKPVFLSVGYSTCHWCHVMAHESFQDPLVAGLINQAFVSIKVDREERPDIDQVYMRVCQMMTGRGGWPLTIIMTADKKPFFSATYIPKRGRFGQMGMVELVPRIRELWETNRDELLRSADQVVLHLGSSPPSDQGQELDVSTLDKAYQALAGIFDLENAGFGRVPKFPTPHNLMFLLRYWQRNKDRFALEMAETTLQAMRLGGIYDQVGQGFHRYSTDQEWLVPHFEKMLYDQSLLVLAYLEAYQATGRRIYSETAREILEFVQREMDSPEGGFYAALDADSEGVEGKFYLWQSEELKDLLNAEEQRLFFKIFDLRAVGNLEGWKILRMRSTLEDAAAVLQLPEQELAEKLEAIRQKLFNAQQKRVRPLRDELILTDWNGLFIAALARAAQVWSDDGYAQAARSAADFLLEKVRTPEGRLFHRYKDGPAVQGNLDDYAFLVWGLIELYEASFDSKYLQIALDLNKAMIDHFWDDRVGGLFFTPDDGESLLVRQKEVYDGAVPSGNSVAMLNLLRLSHLTGTSELEERAAAISQAFSGVVSSQPLGHSMFMCALEFIFGSPAEVVLAGKPGEQGTLEMLSALRSRFFPSMVVLMAAEDLGGIANFAAGLSKLEDKVTAYVCAGHKCELPTTRPAEMLEILEGSLERSLRDGNLLRASSRRPPEE
jgi:uncharacterized protein YyaL (SSP411 family)